MSTRRGESCNREEARDRPDRERREALRSIARFGLYVTPAMTVLLSPAEAFHPTRGHCQQNPNIKGCSDL
jgi:hypothetical protein